MQKQTNGNGNSRVTDAEVSARPKRRTFKAAYKLRILKELDDAVPGGIGAILRREGLYSSHATTWRQEREEGALAALGKKRGRKPTRTAGDDEVERLKREVARLNGRLAQAELIIGIQKKVSALLGIATPLELDESSS